MLEILRDNIAEMLNCKANEIEEFVRVNSHNSLVVEIAIDKITVGAPHLSGQPSDTYVIGQDANPGLWVREKSKELDQWIAEMFGETIYGFKY